MTTIAHSLKIMILNGPNLNMLGLRDTARYGTLTLDQIINDLRSVCENLGCKIIANQSNHEGELIGFLQQARERGFDGIIFNPGGYTHTSVAIRDAVDIARELGVPTMEVHLTDISQREHFRRVSLLNEEPSVVLGQIKGQGGAGYAIALEALVRHIRAGQQPPG